MYEFPLQELPSMAKNDSDECEDEDDDGGFPILHAGGPTAPELLEEAEPVQDLDKTPGPGCHVEEDLDSYLERATEACCSSTTPVYQQLRGV